MKHAFSLILLLGSALPAHAQYALRWVEVEQAIGAYAQPQVKETMRSHLMPEFIQRSGALEDARKNVLRSTDVKPLKEQWERFHQDQAERRAKQFDDFAGKTKEAIERAKLDEKDPTRASLAWLGQVKAQQVDFHNKLKAMPLASLRDLLASKRDIYETEIAKLERAVAALESSDNSLDATAKSYQATLLQACTDMRATKIRFEQEISRLPIPKNLKEMNASEAKAFSAFLAEVTHSLVTDMQRFEGTVRDGIGRIQQVHAQEWDIMNMLAQRRKAVADFEKAFNLSSAQVQFALDLDRAGEIAGKLETTGDKRDMTQFLDNARADLKPHLDAFDGTYAKFMKFKGTLLAPFDGGTSERFVEFAQWEDWADDVRALAVVDILKDIGNSASNGWHVRANVIADAEARSIVTAALTDANAKISGAIGRPMGEAQRLADIVQLQDRRKMVDALMRG